VCERIILHLGSIVFGFENIYRAYLKCRKNKRNSLNALEFEYNLIENLYDLKYDLQTRNYKIGKSICFLSSTPKLREVFAATFRDRVVHHLLVPSLEAYYEPKFIYDVYNNRQNRGIHLAIKRSKKFMNIYREGYYLQFDIKGFFYNLDKNILFKKIFDDVSNSNLEHKQEILWLSNRIIYHNPTRNYIFKGNPKDLEKLPPHKSLFKIPNHKGLAIGNLTSQFFANVYMNDFDNYLKRVLKVRYYMRYVDDGVIFHYSKAFLEEILKEIKSYLWDNLALNLREDVKIQKNREGLDFLGYIVRPDYILVRNRVVNNYKQKKAKYIEKYESPTGLTKADTKKFQSINASFVGHCKHANSYNLIKQVGEIKEDEDYYRYFTHFRDFEC